MSRFTEPREHVMYCAQDSAQRSFQFHRPWFIHGQLRWRCARFAVCNLASVPCPTIAREYCSVDHEENTDMSHKAMFTLPATLPGLHTLTFTNGGTTNSQGSRSSFDLNRFVVASWDAPGPGDAVPVSGSTALGPMPSSPSRVTSSSSSSLASSTTSAFPGTSSCALLLVRVVPRTDSCSAVLHPRRPRTCPRARLWASRRALSFSSFC
jgi:hypothetical protein